MKSNGLGGLVIALGVVGGAMSVRAAPVGSEFTYQGQLKDAGRPAAGLHDLRFRLYDARVGGVQVGATLCVNDVPVADGFFIVPLDFGAQFAGQERFLEIEVRADTGLDCANLAGFDILVPRQPLTATPHAQFAAKPWATSGANISYLTGNVGIGSDSPTSMLHFRRPYSDTGIRFQSLRFDQGAPGATLRAPKSVAIFGAGRIWSAPASALISDDVRAVANFAAAAGTPDDDQSQLLQLSNFGFALPAQATIAGIVVQVESQTNCSCADCDLCQIPVALELLGGEGPSRRSELIFSDTESTKSAGSTFDMWNLNWTPAQVNAASFGVRLSARLDLLNTFICFPGFPCSHIACDCTGSGTAFIDAVTIIVHFFNAPTTSTPVDWSLGLSQDDTDFRIAATPDLSSPALVVTSQGSVGIGTTAFSNGFFKLAVNGAVAKPNGGQWSALSDARLKRGVEPLHGALDRMLSLRGVTFEFTEEGLRTGLALPGRHTGLIAQEVEAVFPEWVSHSPSGYKFLSEYGTTAWFVEALRDLRAEKDAQIAGKESEIAELKERLARVEAILAIPIPREKKSDR
ncbi:MAG: tail fiber domain-containing protein [Planctomycetota bacterium]